MLTVPRVSRTAAAPLPAAAVDSAVADTGVAVRPASSDGAVSPVVGVLFPPPVSAVPAAESSVAAGVHTPAVVAAFPAVFLVPVDASALAAAETPVPSVAELLAVFESPVASASPAA